MSNNPLANKNRKKIIVNSLTNIFLSFSMRARAVHIASNLFALRCGGNDFLPAPRSTNKKGNECVFPKLCKAVDHRPGTYLCLNFKGYFL